MSKPKVYLCARVSKDAHAINNRIIDCLNPYFEVFAPHKKEVQLKDPINPLDIYNLDMDAMSSADICLTIAPYGKDCSWEMGHFVGQNKPVFMYISDVDSIPSDEWMVGHGVSMIITNNVDVFSKCQSLFTWLVLFSQYPNIGMTINNYYKNGGR